MNYVHIHEGLGNQMFQYVFLLSLRKKGVRNVRMLRLITDKPAHNGYELDKVFGIRERFGMMTGLHDRNLWKVFRKTHRFVDEPVTFRYHPDILPKGSRNVVLHGFWQSLGYFEGCGDRIREVFRFDARSLNPSSKKAAEAIAACNSVSVHIRRGDYLSEACMAAFGGVCPEDYYTAAIAHMEARVDNPHFFVFSDDKEWAREHFTGGGFTVVEGNEGADSWQDMYLMSICRHNIIANSSFSWWGAWLNGNPSKTVVAPRTWFKGEDAAELIPSEWVRL